MDYSIYNKQNSTANVIHTTNTVASPIATAPTMAEHSDNISFQSNTLDSPTTADHHPNASGNELLAVHGFNNDNLVDIPNQYTKKAEKIHQNTYDSLIALIQAAKTDGINLLVVSAYRSYNHQKSIWERKWDDTADDNTNKALDILKWSSFPGTSRHHWGSDVDFNSVENNYWQNAEGIKLHKWLSQNAPKFGFCQVYAEGRTHGYSDEPWHWSHMPTADFYYQQITNPQTLAVVYQQDVKGVQAVRMLSNDLMNYITGIKSCHYTP